MIEWYGLVKGIHIGCAVTSGSLFFLRGCWRLGESPLVMSVWSRWVPHLVDTVFLTSALWLAFMLNQYPFAAPWVTAKFLALLIYIGFGAATLRVHGKVAQWVFFVLANLVFVYIVMVALSKDYTLATVFGF